MDGPCRIELEVDEGVHRVVECDAGGSMTLLAPAATIEAASQGVMPRCACQKGNP
jgi:hypothetical protein